MAVNPITEAEQQRILVQKESDCHYNQTPPSLFCPQIWDSILCWPPAPPGETSVQSCPSYILGFNSTNNASRKCEDDGSWYKNPTTNQTWANYSQCLTAPYTEVVIRIPLTQNVSHFISEKLVTVKTVSQIGYGISLVTLLIAFCILASFKKLRCPRNLLHMHLFVSFMMRSFFSLLKAALFVSGVALSKDFQTAEGQMYLTPDIQKTWTCKIISTGWTYFQLANYTWLLMEGLYLHNLIFLALFSDANSIYIYTIFGWGLPFLFVSFWVVFRILFENKLCWTTNENLFIFGIIRVPIIISILLNFCMFINIIRVLMVKLRASMTEETRRLRRWAKSTLVLVPLFGVQYVLSLAVSAVQSDDERIQITWLFFDQLFGSFQGCVVAILYCFMNSEVQAELKKLTNKMNCYSRTKIRCRRTRLSCCGTKLSCCRTKPKKRPSTDVEAAQEMNVSSVRSANSTEKSYLTVSSDGKNSVKIMNQDKPPPYAKTCAGEDETPCHVGLLSEENTHTDHCAVRRSQWCNGYDVHC